MVLRQVRIGNLIDIHQYDDAVHIAAIDTDDQPIEIGQSAAGTQALRQDQLPTLANIVSAIANITDHSIVRGDGGVKGIQESLCIILDDGRTGIAIAPTAFLHIKAGLATAGFAPLKFESGVLLTVPEAGVMEFDGTGLYLTPTNHRRFISLASDSIITTATATTVASTTLWTGITNANELKAYRVYHIVGCGLVNNVNAAGVATITINFGATALITFTTPGAKLTNDPWHIDAFITVRTTGVAGTVSGFGMMMVNAVTGAKMSHTVTESAVVDTTIANDATIKVTWSGADADNWIKLTQCWIAFAD